MKFPDKAEMYEELNKVRRFPNKYSETLKKYLDYFDGNKLKIPGKKLIIQTHEGKAAFEKTIEWLKNKNQ